MKKTFLFSIILVTCGALAAAQNAADAASGLSGAAGTDSSSTEQIDLPEVTTVVTTSSMTAESDTLPDFADVLETSDGSGKIVPELPDMDLSESKNLELPSQTAAENSIYGEGELGGGYPIGMYGSFKVYKLNPASPFQFSFLHDSAAGYAGTALSEGYNDSLTQIGINKAFNLKNVTITSGLDYENDRNGLQNKVTDISDISQNYVNTNAGIKWTFGKGFNLGGNVNLDYYNRYLDIAAAAVNAAAAEAAELNSSAFTDTFWSIYAIPQINFGWENYGFKVDVNAQYDFAKETELSHRGQTGFDFSWKNDYVKLFAGADLVFGNHIGQNTILVPFDAGVNASFPVKFATRQFGIKAEGGMDSSRKTAAELEKLYKFSAADFTAEETSDWFGLLELSVPVKSSLLFNGKVEYRHTAFGNGIVEPVYSGTAVNGLYTYNAAGTERQKLITDFNVNYNYGIFSLAAQWYSNWLYVPVLECPNQVNLRLAVQDKNSKWNVTLLTGFYFVDNGIDIPLISLDGQLKVTDAVNLDLSVNDVVNLFGGMPRTYAGQYISRGGSAAVLVKFFF